MAKRKLTEVDIIDNISNGKIGLYMDELIPDIKITKNA